jgi:hypothetical protein
MRHYGIRMPDSARHDLETAAQLLGQEPSIIMRTALYGFIDELQAHQREPAFYEIMIAKIRAARGRDAA